LKEKGKKYRNGFYLLRFEGIRGEDCDSIYFYFSFFIMGGGVSGLVVMVCL
jgi:hypothetical protein